MPLRETPRIISRRLNDPDAWRLERYLETDGYDALRKAVTGLSPAAVHAEVRASGITGRSGGAAFPTANKWELLRQAEPKYVVVNGDESEPGFFKDRTLMELDPHQLVEGTLLCAYAVGAKYAVIYIRGEFALAQERVTQAVNDAYDIGAAGASVFGSDFDCDVVVQPGAGAYIVGEETALLESLEGKRGFPRIKPPAFPATFGLYGAPTIVNNVETLATLPWIVANGGEAYHAYGGGRFFGTRLFSLAGRVNKPGVYEVELHHPTFRDLFFDQRLGGGIRDDGRVRAFIPGASFPWFFEEQLDLHLDGDEVSANGSSLGAGILVLDETCCPVRAAWRLVRFFARESCGQCTPCREGTSWLEKIMHRIEHGDGRKDDLELLLDVGDNISPGPFPHPPRPELDEPARPFPYNQTTICPLGPSGVSPIDSTVWKFRDDYLRHIEEGACPYKR
ncbi:MAG TPA: NADH-ubiquinone oxidoreductase-F iron-sulfur binding region domain-containing protein [Acidimicrobiales bacterium]|nr:NADH-ubiquinone oxidoreductase-F iron-sulfur binding region domain-containing protein [Acidimicrobiales bacterium]